jgi:hypothetical protein
MLVEFKRFALAGENYGSAVGINPDQVESVIERPESAKDIHKDAEYTLLRMASGDMIGVEGSWRAVMDALNEKPYKKPWGDVHQMPLTRNMPEDDMR